MTTEQEKKLKEQLTELLTEIAEWDKDYSSTRHKLMAKEILRGLN